LFVSVQYGIEKQVEMLNEHNEAAAASVMLGWLQEDKSIALISDAGITGICGSWPVACRKAIHHNIKIIPLPGASSLLPALMCFRISIKEFVVRQDFCRQKRKRLVDYVTFGKGTSHGRFNGTPTALCSSLRDMADVLGGTRRVCVAFDLTLSTEEIFHGTLPKLYQKFLKEEKKGEFVVVLEGIKK